MVTILQEKPLTELYKARRGQVEFVNVPELAYAVVPGEGDPNGDAFAAAIKALYSVSYGAHFLVRKATGASTKVMPLEALWWVDEGDFAEAARTQWRWEAMIVQPDPIDADTIVEAVAQARAKGIPSLDDLRYGRRTEGLCAQVLYVGPYADEHDTIVMLHAAIASAGYVLRGAHHEIYLGDPRRSAPEKLRTIIRQPVAPAG